MTNPATPQMPARINPTKVGDVVVSYESGLHHRQQSLGTAACLTTAADTSSCTTG